ncbi:MAG: hypothetical protein HY717_14220 [Planctomycetes bacterium]|nr:hypothetical protein [Planctomycetota bacterium]
MGDSPRIFTKPVLALAGAAFLFCLGLFGLTHSGRFHLIDEYETFFMAESLLARGEASIPQAEGSPYFFGKRGVDGRLYAPYGLGQALLTVPFLLAGEQAGRCSSAAGEFWRYFLTSISAAFYSALAVALFLLWQVRRGAAPRRAAWAAMLLAAGTLVWAYATQYRSNTVVLMLFVMLALASEHRSAGGGFFLLAGSLLAVLARSDALLGIAVIGVYRAWEPLGRKNGIGALRAVLPLALGSALALSLAAGLSWLHFGSPLDGGYPSRDDLGRPAYAFGLPQPEAALALLVSPGKGLLLLSPLLLLSAWKLPRLSRERPRSAALALGMGLGYLVFFSAWQHYEGGWCFGPRFLLPVVPFLLLPLVDFPPPPSLWRLALAWGAVVNGLAVSVNFLAVARAGDYYHHLEDPFQTMRYNFWHHPLAGHAGRLCEGLSRLGSPHWVESNFGTGLDFWWVYAAREGIPAGVALAIAAFWIMLMGAGLLIFLWRPQRLQNP